MTRKEPKFNDDLTTSVSVGLPKEPARDQSKSASHRAVRHENTSKSGSSWLLWLFVLASLCVSFGTAFFGLEEHFTCIFTLFSGCLKQKWGQEKLENSTC